MRAYPSGHERPDCLAVRPAHRPAAKPATRTNARKHTRKKEAAHPYAGYAALSFHYGLS